jgi:signal peptidase I
MGDVLPGPHWKVDCHACGFPFRCGIDRPPAEFAVCPNCGFDQNPVDRSSPRRGQRVLVDQFSTSVRPPRRWEVVVARLPGEPPQVGAKRVVGLPGELISIRRGDVYANGKRLGKDIDQQRTLRVLVHADRFRPSEDGGGHPRWRPRSGTSRWQRGGDAICYVPAQPGDGVGATSLADSPTYSAASLDWLVYHHQPCLPIARGISDESPVTDNYGYNQGLSRKLSKVTDLLLSCRVRLTGSGLLAVQAHDGQQVLRLRWDVGRSRIVLDGQGAVLAETSSPGPPEGRSVQLEVMICDQRIQLALDGHTHLAYTYGGNEDPPCPIAQPLAIGAVGMAVEIADLCVWRDVYYTHPYGLPADWSMSRPLSEDEFFLLGDNSPISVDSRHAAGKRCVRRRDIVGRVWPPPRLAYPEFP